MLKGYQKAYLKSLAHHKDPVVIIGKLGASEALLTEISFLLEKQELLKIKFNEFKDQKTEILEQITKGTRSDLVQLIGNIAILYKQADKDENRIIKVPSKEKNKAVVTKVKAEKSEKSTRVIAKKGARDLNKSSRDDKRQTFRSIQKRKERSF